MKVVLTAILSSLVTLLLILNLQTKPVSNNVDNVITKTDNYKIQLAENTAEETYIRPTIKKISIASYDWVPFHSNRLPNGGFTADLIREIFEPQGYEVEKTFYPWERAQHLVQKGDEYNAITEIYFTQERLKHYWYGSAYATQEVYLIAIKEHPIDSYESLEDLKEYQFGINRGASHGSEFDNTPLKKIEVKSYGQGIEMIILGRIDFFVSSKSVAFYEARLQGKEGQIKTIGKPIKKQYLHMAFSKKDPDNYFRMEDYNIGLFNLHTSGRYQELLRKHKMLGEE